jgi:hypothetical protein
MTHPFYTCDASGVTIRHAAPPTEHPRNFKTRPVQFSVNRDRSLQLHGEHFTATMRLSTDEAIGLAMLLMFTVREDAHAMTRPAEVRE